MNRRDLIRATVLLGISSVALSRVRVHTEPLSAKRVSFRYDIERPYRGDVRLWIPVPVETDYQKLTGVEVKGTHRRISLHREKVFGTPILYAEFPKDIERKRIEVKVSVEFRPRRVSMVDGSFRIPKEVRKYLEPSAHIPTEGKVRDLATEITKGRKTMLEKAWAIYKWVAENTYRDPEVKGCGPGDVNSLLEMLERTGKIGGKCADQSSIFIAMCRSVGIPAREVFGIRVLPSELSTSLSIKPGSTDLTKAQHCRAEFWAGEWIPVDPADVTKVVLKERPPKDHPRVEFAKVYLFGSWDPHWVAYNWARDFVLEPEQEEKPLNFFGYPYAEVDGTPVNWLEPETFVYRIRKVSA
ncbi:MAG: transglutaminase family protein [Aquificota bacterium]|nr:transglutaminase family protein [Aquificota bacterium]